MVQGDVATTLQNEQFAAGNLPLQSLSPRQRGEQVLLAPHQLWATAPSETGFCKSSLAAVNLLEGVRQSPSLAPGWHLRPVDAAEEILEARIGAQRLPVGIGSKDKHVGIAALARRR